MYFGVLHKKNIILIYLLLFLLVFVSCSAKQEDNVSNNDTKVSEEDVQQDISVSADAQERYVSEFLELENIEDMSNLSFSNNEMYYLSYVYDEITQTGYNELFSVNMDTWEKSRVEVILDAGENIYAMRVCEEDKIILLTSAWDEVEGIQTYKIKVLDENRQEIAGGDITAIFEIGTEEYFNDLKTMEMDEEGNIYLLLKGAMDSLIVLNKEGQEQFEIKGDGNFIDICRGRNGQIFVLQDDAATGSYYFGGYKSMFSCTLG